GEQAVGIQVLADAVATPKIKCGGAGGNEEDATSLIDAHARPAVHTTNIGPRVRRPGLGSRLAGIWNRVKSPHNLSTADIVGTDMSWGRRRGAFPDPQRKEQEIAINGAGCGGSDEELADITAEALFDVNAPLSSERLYRPTGVRAHRIEEMIGGEENSA